MSIAPSSVAHAGAHPVAWRSADLQHDTSWIHTLSPEAITGFEAALAHAEGTGKDMLAMSPVDFPLAGAALAGLRAAIAQTQRAFGLCLLRGFPVERWSVAQAELVMWGIGLHTGVARTQGRESKFLSHVRDEGAQYRNKGGRGYNTNAELDFHCDFCDLVGLFCLQQARIGGQSFITSSMAVYEEIGKRRPDLAAELERPFHYSFQGAQSPGDAPWFTCPVFGTAQGRFASRHNLKNVLAAHRDFPEIAPLTATQDEALQLWEKGVRETDLCYSMELHPGDIQLLNNHVVMHSRSSFEDWPEPERRRHLIRFWLSLPKSQPMPEGWRAGYKCIAPGSVRGGLRGSHITDDFLDYERRLAKIHQMALVQQERAATQTSIA